MTKVKEIYIENLMAIKNTKAEFNGKSAIVIAGNNRGKTTLMTLLSNRLQGVRPDILLHTGEHEGVYRMEFTTGERFEWEINDTNKLGNDINQIKYFTSDNIKMPVTTTIANTFFPSVFDVNSFLTDPPQKQQKALQNLGGINFDEIDKRWKNEYEKRTDANREVKQAEAKLKPIDNTLPLVEVDIIEKQKVIAGIDAHNAKFNYVKKGVTDKQDLIVKNDKEIARLQKLIDGLNKENKTHEKDIKNGQTWMKVKENALKDEDENFKLNQELQDIIDKNKKIVSNNEAIALKKSFTELKTKADNIDKNVKAIEKEKTDLIKTAKLPPEFGFSEDGITYNGFPFTENQQSLSARYIAALKLSFLGLGKVKMIHFDASPLTNASLNEVLDWAKENDLQILVERPDVENDGEIQYTLIEDIK